MKVLSKEELIKFSKLIESQLSVDGPLKMNNYFFYGWTKKNLQNIFELTEDPEHGLHTSNFKKHPIEIKEHLDNIEDVLIFPDEKDKNGGALIH